MPVNSEVRKSLETKVLDSILRTLNFYNSQLDQITTGDTALSLKLLKGEQTVHYINSQTKHSFDFRR